MGVRNREYTEIIKLLKAYGCWHLRNSKGSHEFWQSPITGKGFIIVKPHGGDKHSADGTFLDMIEKAGITKEQAKAFKENKCKR